MGSSSDEEEIQCLKEETIKTIAGVLKEDLATELSEAWMIDDVGTMNSESDKDNELLEVKKNSTKGLNITKMKKMGEKEKTAEISNNPLSVENEERDKEDGASNMSEAWMIDDVGTMNSESEEENEPLSTNKSHDVTNLGKKEKDNGKIMTNITEPTIVEDIEIRYSSIKRENDTLPKMDSPSNEVNIVNYDEKAKTERAVTLSEAWMIDDVGKMDSNSEDENDSPLLTGNSQNIDSEQKVKDNKATDPPTDSKIYSSRYVKPQEECEKESINNLSEAWMIVDVGTIDSESEEENEPSQESNVFLDNKNVAEKTDKDKTQKTNDLSEAWMIDDLGKMDSESEEEYETLHTAGEKETVNKEIVNDLSEAWMIDDVGTMNSESEEENEPLSTNKSHDINNLEKKEKDNRKMMTNVTESTIVEDIETRNSSIKKENETLPKMDSPSNEVDIVNYDEK